MKNTPYLATIATFFITASLFFSATTLDVVHAQEHVQPILKPTPIPLDIQEHREQVEEVRYFPVNMDNVYISTPYSSKHPGIDFASRIHNAPLPVASIEWGSVVYAGNTSREISPFGYGFGNLVVIEHDDGILSLYAHLKSIEVEEGRIVQQGDPIGVMGSTGNSTGTHLHFEIMIRNDEQTLVKQNPIAYTGFKKMITLLAQGVKTQ